MHVHRSCCTSSLDTTCARPRQHTHRPYQHAARCTAIRRHHLGKTGISVPELCFGGQAPWKQRHLLLRNQTRLSCCAAAGTMLFGESTSAAEAHQLLDHCFENGINFFDTAEMYPVPQRAETAGQSEVILGQWMKQHARYNHANRSLRKTFANPQMHCCVKLQLAHTSSLACCAAPARVELSAGVTPRPSLSGAAGKVSSLLPRWLAPLAR
jgi:hypothetical protein